MIHDVKATVLENLPLSPRLYRLTLFVKKELLKAVKPGHFGMIKPSPTYDPVGRRAFAFADLHGSEAVFFYEVVGKGTALLSAVKEGEELSLLFPLGRRLFSTEGNRHLLVAGGVGLAGLTLLAKELRASGKEVFVAYGAKSKEHLGLLYWLEEEGFPFVAYTEDGSFGRKGRVTEVLKEFDESWTVHACGPKPMLRAVKELTDGRAYLSLEERMACGWGVCLGCVVKTPQGYKRVCYEGPVFRAEEVEI